MSEDGKPSGKARDKVGAFAGISGRTLEKIAGLSMRPRPTRNRLELLKAMDKSGRVNGVYRRPHISNKPKRSAQNRRPCRTVGRIARQKGVDDARVTESKRPGTPAWAWLAA